MNDHRLKTIVAAIILAGQYAEGNPSSRGVMIKEALLTTDALLEALDNPTGLNKQLDARYGRPA